MILSLGSINADFQLRVERWPHPGETLPGREFALLPGGKAANVAVLARRLEVPALLLGKVGRDALAEVALCGPRAAGVGLESVQIEESLPTGTAMIAVREDGEKTILLAPNANDEWNEGEMGEVLHAVDSAPEGAVLVADLEVPAALVERAAAAAQRRRLKVVLDPSPAAEMRDALHGLCDVLTPNASEAGALAGIEVRDLRSAEEAARRLVERAGEGAVVVKAQHGDCVLASAKGLRRFKAPPVQAVDATGAGDAFAGALAVALLEGRAMEEAVLMAMAAASCAVQIYGSQAAYPERRALEARLEALRRANPAR